MDSQKSYFVGQLRSLVAPTPSSAAFPLSEETASHPDWLHAFTILRLNDVGLTPEQHRRRLRNGLREFNGAIPAATDKGDLSLPPATAAATTRSVTQILRPTRPPLQPVAILGGEFVCWHAFLASWRIYC
jgi:hypothetical protein